MAHQIARLEHDQPNRRAVKHTDACKFSHHLATSPHLWINFFNFGALTNILHYILHYKWFVLHFPAVQFGPSFSRKCYFADRHFLFLQIQRSLQSMQLSVFQLFTDKQAMTTSPSQQQRQQHCQMKIPPLPKPTLSDALTKTKAEMEDSASQSCQTNFSAAIQLQTF